MTLQCPLGVMGRGVLHILGFGSAIVCFHRFFFKQKHGHQGSYFEFLSQHQCYHSNGNRYNFVATPDEGQLFLKI